MLTSGKFNSSREFLGLDQLVVNEEGKTGLYTINTEEIKTVEWIMKTFINDPNYSNVLRKIEKKGIKNKGDIPFTRATLKGLLTNTRYIGKWERNPKNKDKKQDKLMPYERYEVVELPHGKAIKLDLWKKVQTAVKKNYDSKNMDQWAKRIFPLTPVLYYHDGSKFCGQGAWSSSGEKYPYYHNKTNKLRIGAALVEEKAKEILADLVKRSPKLIEALSRRDDQVDERVEFFRSQISAEKARLEDLSEKREKLEKRLDFLLDGEDLEEAKRSPN